MGHVPSDSSPGSHGTAVSLVLSSDVIFSNERMVWWVLVLVLGTNQPQSPRPEHATYHSASNWCTIGPEIYINQVSVSHFHLSSLNLLVLWEVSFKNYNAN